jgi:hypothetical protein
MIGENKIDGVREFKYLGTLISCDNKNVCIRERIQAANRAFYANMKLFKSRILSRNTKLQLYTTMVRPVVTYAAETWVMTAADENALKVFERSILRKIFGPVCEMGQWRIRKNRELEQLIGNADVVKFIKSQRIAWLGHVMRMEDTRMPKIVWRQRLHSRRRRGRPRARWMDQVMEDLRIMGVRRWRELVMDRGRWRGVVREARAHQGL